MDKQQRPIEEHMELCSMLCARLNRSGVWGRMDICIYMAESLHCSPKTTTLLISYTPIQNAFGVKNIKINKIQESLYPHLLHLQILAFENIFYVSFAYMYKCKVTLISSFLHLH